jgi:subtilisin family serine protease
MKSNNYWKISLLFLSLLTSQVSVAQHSWVYLVDKCSSEPDYFKAEVCDTYINALKHTGAEILGSSKWLNAVCVPDADLVKVKGLPFIAQIQPLGKYTTVEERIDEDFSYGQGDWQIEMMNLNRYHQMGFTGKNVTLAVFDGGFWKVDSLPIFDSMRVNKQIKAAYDFVDNDTLRYDESTHGMQVLALAGINYPDSMVGAAPGANFVLARTEDTRSETHLEELNWLNAMEWADSVGVDIIHSSLGYSLFDTIQGDYSYQDMDGKSTLITLAAEQAAERGIFITNSAGNSGNDPWFYITAPCDGKNVLCIGAVDSFQQVTEFSSRGPSADGRIKPDVTAMGSRNTIPNRDGILRRGSGTSFSGPLVAGLVACLKGAHPNKSNAQIFEAILISCDRYGIPDNEYGHGIPDALRADSVLTEMPVLGVGELKPLEALVYPNPVKDVLTIRTTPGAVYTLLDYQGRIVKEGTLHNMINFMDVSDKTSGVYYLKVRKDNSSTVVKVLVGSR